MFIDNAFIHILNNDIDLTNITIKYLPDNLTSLLYSLDAEKIRTVKILDRKFQILSIIQLIDSEQHASELSGKLTVLNAIKLITESWEMV